jgi:hypothetical protein
MDEDTDATRIVFEQTPGNPRWGAPTTLPANPTPVATAPTP